VGEDDINPQCHNKEVSHEHSTYRCSLYRTVDSSSHHNICFVRRTNTAGNCHSSIPGASCATGATVYLLAGVFLFVGYHPALTPEQLGTLRDYFAHTIRDLHIDVRDVRVQLAANTATVTFFRTDRFIDRLTERHIEKSIQLSTVLEYGTNGWRLGGLDQVAFALGNRTRQAG
jgi:hypothetical protein